MAYDTGTANDINALRSAIFAGCAAAGWTLSGSTLTKGALAMQIDVQTITGSGFVGLRFRGGTGEAGGVVTGGAPWASDIGTQTLALSYPVTYHLFVFDDPVDEVYIVVNYDVDRYQWAAWGQSSIALPGTGLWFGASLLSQNLATASSVSVQLTAGGSVGSVTYFVPTLFLRAANQSRSTAGYGEAHIHHGLDGVGWSQASPGQPGPSAQPAAAQLLCMLPSAWNGESVLVPIHVCLPRPSQRRSLVASLTGARYLRIDNHAPGEIIPIGGEEWMVFPWLRKTSAARNGMAAASAVPADIHSGTMGWCIRYEEP